MQTLCLCKTKYVKSDNRAIHLWIYAVNARLSPLYSQMTAAFKVRTIDKKWSFEAVVLRTEPKHPATGCIGFRIKKRRRKTRRR
jgi:hypothetical protein